MMRIVSILLVLMFFSLALAQEAGTTNPPQQERKTPPNAEEYHAMILAQIEELKKEQENAPKTLAEAHARLERTLSAETLAKIDAMPSEDGMIQYHFSLGLNIRNGWGLWKGGPLAQHMRELGFTHPDDMSGVILDTFWCKRHGKDFRLEERAAQYKEYWDATKKAEEEKERRVEESKAAIRNMMMGLRFEKRDVPVVLIPVRNGANVRFMCPFRGGVFLCGYCQGSISEGPDTTGGQYFDPADNSVHIEPQYDDGVRRGFCYDRAEGRRRKMKPGEDFYIQGWYFDLADGKLHWIRPPEVNDVYAALVVGGRAWFAGMTDGKAVLVGINDADRIVVPLPQEDEIPDLGFDGESLLAIYFKTIHRLDNETWTLVHSGDIVLPRSGLPPQRFGNLVFFRDEGQREMRKRLWWLSMGEKLHLHLLDRNTGLFKPIVSNDPGGQVAHLIGPPGWEEMSSYCVTSKGDLWACVGGGSYLLRRSIRGEYSFAVAGGSIRVADDQADPNETNQSLYISGVTALPDNTLLLVGYTGLYRLKGNDLIQELAFAPRGRNGKPVGRGNWSPNTVIALDDGLYCIGSGSWDGIYLLRQGDDGQWTVQSPGRGDPVVW
ncbi:MAG: DUF6794 domain-containing protein [Sedimentisphaerales bacterium]|jgi:hypothetical protein|nr:DUF6794 domain-containing protein [Sedimentisphaerales bacterium]HNY78975.1 hypothetical protein [Sedimentisphaerales bacterium]HOC64076.1 hypothetical protein [Sedimentisphaerales bacterium]HOH64889.1 hypothetical protein [Sedimentisphaerales bacterium]HQA89968.1 hypothetical protein [Sedimentisphaerales bacterium]